MYINANNSKEFFIIVKKQYNRWVSVIATIFIQLCLRMAYIWSVIQKGVATYLFDGIMQKRTYDDSFWQENLVISLDFRLLII